MKQTLTKGQQWLYGLALLGGNMVYMITASYTMTYFNVYVGLSSAFVGMILMIARVFDAVNDPLTGVIVAKVNFKGGRFRPWLKSGAVINGVILFGLFAYPEAWMSDEGKKMIWCAAFYLLWSTSYDLFDIPIWSIVPAVTTGGKDRDSMATLGRTFASIGCGIVSVATMTLVPILGGGVADNYIVMRKGFMIYAGIIAVIYILFTFIFTGRIKGKDNNTVDLEDTITIGEMFRALFKNSQAMAVVVAITAINLATGITSNLLIYFFQFDLGTVNANWNSDYSLFNVALFGFQVIAMMVIYPVLRKIMSRKGIFVFALVSAIIGYVVLCAMAASGVTNIYMLMIPGFLVGAPTGLLNILTTVYLADSVDFGEYQNGHRDESVVFSMQTFVVKLASGLAAGAVGYILVWINLDTTEGAINTNEVLMTLRLVMAIIPIAGLIFALIFFCKKFVLTEKKMTEISAALGKTEALEPAAQQVEEPAVESEPTESK